MSYDFAIWKRSPTTKTAMLVEVYASICEGRDHAAMTIFDLSALEEAIRVEFGDQALQNDGLLVCESGAGSIANWLIVQCARSAVKEITPRLVHIAEAQGLLVYDPQRITVWGNKRPQKIEQTRT